MIISQIAAVQPPLQASLWIAQLILFMVFAIVGTLKLAAPIPTLARAMSWVGDTPAPVVRFIGMAEVAGALGLVLPPVTHIAPMLTPLAAAGLALVMVFAIPVHIKHHELARMSVPIALGALAAFVAWTGFHTIPLG
jgi:hypothetical protein